MGEVVTYCDVAGARNTMGLKVPSLPRCYTILEFHLSRLTCLHCIYFLDMFLLPGKGKNESHNKELIFTECLLCARYYARTFRNVVFLIPLSNAAGEEEDDTQSC